MSLSVCDKHWYLCITPASSKILSLSLPCLSGLIRAYQGLLGLIRRFAIVHLGLNVSSSAHNCGCVVDGGNAMAAI